MARTPAPTPPSPTSASSIRSSSKRPRRSNQTATSRPIAPSSRSATAKSAVPAGSVVYRMELATAPDPAAVVAVVTATPHGERDHVAVSRRPALGTDLLLARLGHRWRHTERLLGRHLVPDAGGSCGRASRADPGSRSRSRTRARRPGGSAPWWWRRSHAGSARWSAPAAALVWRVGRPASCGRTARSAAQFLPGTRRQLGVHGSRRRHAAHV